MPCYHPNRVFYTGRTNPTGGKETYYQASYLPKRLSMNTASKRLRDLRDAKLSDLKGEIDEYGRFFFTDSQPVPCGKCVGCKLDYSRNWATRMMIEAANYGNKTAFLTLTYDDEHLPKDNKPDKQTMQLFLKRLRKKYGKGLRIAYCGEKGSMTGRSHYHLIVLGIEINDLRPYNKNLSTSTTIDKLWGLGNVLIGSVTFNSAAYVARYMLKKAKDDTDTFFVASRRPGLGYDYMHKHGELFANGTIYIPAGDKNQLRIPKYYRYLMKKEDPETYEALKGCSNEEQEEIMAMELYAGVGSYERVLEYKERVSTKQEQRHKRPL